MEQDAVRAGFVTRCRAAPGIGLDFGNRVSKLPDFEGLAIFAKVVQTGSFVGAAQELRLSKATVSKAVSRIEEKFGTRLFNRTARGLALTEAGRELYDRAAHILVEGEAAENEVDLVDDKGRDLSLELPFEQARAIATLLPSLPERAWQARGVDTSARFVLPLDRWTVEESRDGTGLLLTLASSDGYEVCFDLPAEACRGLGLVLRSCKGIERPIDRTATPS